MMYLLIAVVTVVGLVDKTEYNIHLRDVGTEMDLLVRSVYYVMEIPTCSVISFMMDDRTVTDSSYTSHIVSWDFGESKNVSRVSRKELSAS